jgi:hypothetical protein
MNIKVDQKHAEAIDITFPGKHCPIPSDGGRAYLTSHYQWKSEVEAKLEEKRDKLEAQAKM